MTKVKQHSARLAGLLMSVSVATMVTGCAVTPEPFTEQDFNSKAAADRVLMFNDQAGLDKPLTLGVAVARVLRYNLDHRAKMMEAAQSLGQLDLDRWDLLPKLATSAGYVGRSNHATTTSRDSVTLQPALSDPYYSTDRDRVTADMTMSWNVLDFGVSYYTTKQNADRAIIAEERRRKAVENLVQEVRTAYWRAVAAQELHVRVGSAIADADGALESASKVETERLRNPLEALRYQKTLLESLRQLEAVNQELSTAKAELAALINIAPGTPFSLAIPTDADMRLPAWTMPVAQMEEMAFSHNPDLREQIYQGRIAIEETRKEILKLLPGITFTADTQYDSNSFLQSKSWNDAAARASWNLISLVSAPDRIHFAENSETLAEKRRLALRMAVLAQVHVSRQQYENAARQFSRADSLYTVERKIAAATAQRQENDAQSSLERIGSETAAIAAELRRYQALAQAEGALGRMEAMLGIDPVTPDMVADDIGALGEAISQRLARLDRGELDQSPTASTGGTGVTAAPAHAEAAAPEHQPGSEEQSDPFRLVKRMFGLSSPAGQPWEL